MYKILKFTCQDFKNTIKSRGFIFSLIAGLAYLLLWLIYKPQAFDIKAYQEELFKVVYMILIYYSCSTLSKEFSFDTYKIIFTSGYSRIQILISKLLHFLLITIMLWVLIQILNPIIGILIGEEYGLLNILSISTLKSLGSYLIMAITLGSFSLLLSVITFNILSSFFISFALCWNIYFFAPIVIQLGDKLGVIWDIITNIPFFIIIEVLYYNSITLNQIIILSLFSMICFTIAAIIIKKRDLKK